MPLRKVPNTEDNEKTYHRFDFSVNDSVYHKPITLWLLRYLCSLYSLGTLVLKALDDIRNMWIIS